VTAYLSNPLALDAAEQAVGIAAQAVADTPLGGILPELVRDWLARVRLLEGVPFGHLVPDSALLPPESARFFYLDREWTDVLVQGALSVGTVTTLDRAHLQAVYPPIRAELDAAERRIRLVGADEPGQAPAETVTGFLLRSRAVSGWPALHVRGYRAEIGPDDGPVADDDPRRLRLLRLERLAPAVLLCLFDGVPAVVHVEEPRQGLQFGVDLAAGDAGTTSATIGLRDVTTAEPVAARVDVPFRRDAPGVVHVAELARRIAAEPATQASGGSGDGVPGAEFAMELLQFPFRQVFGDPELGTVPGGRPLGFAEVFAPTVGIEEIRSWM
jgi:hypothetical protein